MADLILPKSLVAHTSAKAADVMADFNAIADLINITGLSKDALQPSAVAGNIVSALKPMTGGEFAAFTSPTDIPGCTYTTATAGTFFAVGIVTGRMGIINDPITGQLIVSLNVDGAEQTRTASAGISSSGGGTVNISVAQIWRVTVGTGKVIKLRVNGGLVGCVATPEGTCMAILQVG